MAVHLHFMRIKHEGLSEEHRVLVTKVPRNLKLRASYEVSDGDEEATYMVWHIEMARGATQELDKHVVLVRQFSREIH